MKRALALIITFIFYFIIPNLVVAHSNHDAKKGVFTKHFDESLFKITEKGLFSVEIVYNEKEYKIGTDLIGIVIHDENDKDLESAFVKVEVDGIPDSSFVVKEKGDGLYTVTGLNIYREGNWKLIINVTFKKKQDKAIFIFPEILSQKKPAGKYNFKHSY